jgi:signal transduction histidine kinase
MEPRPLSEGNALQRAYARWAAPHYARMAPELREQAELVDRFLYSRRGLGFWLGLIGATAGSAIGLTHAGMPVLLATALSLIAWVVLPLSALSAWLQPRKFSIGNLRRKLPAILVLTFAGSLSGFLLGHVAKRGGLDLATFFGDLLHALYLLVPAGLGAAVAMLALTWGLARVRRQMLERVLERERLAHERDLAARQAAEAQLKLLQAQIQPHFIFNTLAALQHWVDSGDPRAGLLLRSLTAFLRGSTELLGRGQVELGTEAETVRQYLQIMQARLGERLRFEVAVAPDCADVVLPPGLLLTLVENAIEHGIAPALAGGRVTVSAARESGAVVLRVRDDGLGLSPQWRDGTGLANCRERLRHHGDGHATLDLRPLDPGTEAVLMLPRAAA